MGRTTPAAGDFLVSMKKMTGPVLVTSDLIFPEASGNFSHTLLSLKRSRLSIRNRLASIFLDAEFVESVAQTYGFPLIANERCGSWYIPPERKGGSVYFKSTDGHQSQWRFSTRRLNLQLLDIVGKHGGCMVTDSTRRGKLMPDALSKTIPIWCAVMNRYLFPERDNCHQVQVSSAAVSASETSQINGLLTGFLEDLLALGLDKTALREKLKNPLRPYFVAPELSLDAHIDPRISAVICCSASRREHGDNDEYIQGAGDDNEHWSQGLTSDAFWAHRQAFKQDASDDHFAEIIAEVMKAVGKTAADGHFQRVYQGDSLGSTIDIGSLDSLRSLAAQAPSSGEEKPYDVVITCDLGSKNTGFPQVAPRFVNLDCFEGKNGGRFLRDELPKLDVVLKFISQEQHCRILASCSSGRDLSIGIAVAIACRLEQSVGNITRINKASIRQRLALITAQYPSANPSRATLQSVNAYLMQQRGVV